MSYLFVYGSLRTIEGHPMHNYLRGLSVFLGDASVGGIVVEAEGEPGVVPSANPDDRVVGELYRIHAGASDELFAVLDHYMGCSEDDPETHGFFRHRLDATLSTDGEVCEAWVYLYNGS